MTYINQTSLFTFCTCAYCAVNRTGWEYCCCHDSAHLQDFSFNF